MYWHLIMHISLKTAFWTINVYPNWAFSQLSLPCKIFCWLVVMTVTLFGSMHKRSVMATTAFVCLSMTWSLLLIAPSSNQWKTLISAVNWSPTYNLGHIYIFFGWRECVGCWWLWYLNHAVHSKHKIWICQPWWEFMAPIYTTTGIMPPRAQQRQWSPSGPAAD